MSRKRVEAAGGVLVREGPEGPMVAVVHRPRYDDWSLPKGKLDRGEGSEQAALREVEEETGYRCELGPELASNSYRDRKDRPKTVRWWLMTPLEGQFRPNDEVDEVQWHDLASAAAAVSYTRDAEIVKAAVAYLA